LATINLKRVYDSTSRTDGQRILVERLWPRGVSRAKLHLNAWLKDVAPSTELRGWFGHDPAKWSRFRLKYVRELDAQPDCGDPSRRPPSVAGSHSSTVPAIPNTTTP
jgi:uncharacterized protein YeaO (DUF488 family)